MLVPISSFAWDEDHMSMKATSHTHGAHIPTCMKNLTSQSGSRRILAALTFSSSVGPEAGQLSTVLPSKFLHSEESNPSSFTERCNVDIQPINIWAMNEKYLYNIYIYVYTNESIVY